MNTDEPDHNNKDFTLDADGYHDVDTSKKDSGKWTIFKYVRNINTHFKTFIDGALLNFLAAYSNNSLIYGIKGKEYCIGTPRMSRCNDCQNNLNWKKLTATQALLGESKISCMVKINVTHCQINDGIHYKNRIPD